MTRLLAVIDAYVAFAVLQKDAELTARLRKGQAWDRTEANHRVYGSEWDYLGGLEEDSRDAYFSLISKRLGAEEGADLADKWRRIHDVAGVTIRVENSDDDPTIVEFIIQDEIADAWADAHGSLAGGTWECVDGPEFVYDITYWHPRLFEELEKEGYDLDFSNYSEPDERDIAIANHLGECHECQQSGDWESYSKHYDECQPGTQLKIEGV